MAVGIRLELDNVLKSAQKNAQGMHCITDMVPNHQDNMSFPLYLCFTWRTSYKADPKTSIQVEGVYLGDDPRKIWFRSEQLKMEKRRKPGQSLSH